MISVLSQIPVSPTQAALDAATFAAGQSDRWHADAILVIFLIAIATLAKWGMKQLEKRDTTISDLGKELGEVRKEYASFAISISEKLAGIIAHNSDVIAANTQLSERKLGVLDRIEQAQKASK